MKRLFAILTVLACLLSICAAQGKALKLKVGDIIHIEVTAPVVEAQSMYGGDLQIARDGAIYGKLYGRVPIAGKTVAEAQVAVRKALSRFVKPQEVYVSLRAESDSFVFMFITSTDDDTPPVGATKGAIPLVPGLTLRQLLSTATFTKDVSYWSVKLFRVGKEISDYALDKILTGPEGEQVLQGNDVVVVSPSRSIRVWLTGMVQKRGRYRLASNSTFAQLATLAGGLIIDESSELSPDRVPITVTVRRAGVESNYQVQKDGKYPGFELMDGDEVNVAVPSPIHYSVLGFVAKPGEYVSRSVSDITKAISQAGGITREGTTQQVLVYRGSEILQIDVNAPEGLNITATKFELKDKDILYVRRNENVYYVLGTVNRPGVVSMASNRVYRLSDVLADAGGLSAGGTLRRVALARPGPSGKAEITQYNLDEYLKDGKVEANPIIKPGDSILFGKPKGLTFENTISAISSFIVTLTLFRR